MPTLDWLNRAEALTAADKVPYRVLLPVAEYTAPPPSVRPEPVEGEGAGAAPGESIHDNLLIHGDNLDALKALLPFYRGRVKCIFIDPQYNTKSAFEHYDDNLEHSQWLSMMQPRLVLLRELLAEDGSIWVTIDDNEGHYLKVLMDEVFGRQNFVANVIWQKKYSPQNDDKGITLAHDHVHIYSKNRNSFAINLLPRTEAMNARYANPDNDPKGVWKNGDLTSKTKAKGHSYPITGPDGQVHYPSPGRQWAPSQDTFDRWMAEGKIWFGLSGTNRPSIKQYLSEVQAGMVPLTIWLREDVGDNQEAKKEITVLNSSEIFDTPKPERLIQRILHIATNPGDLILDSFLGSGTTAAVAHKMGRRWIGIEMGGHAETHCIPRMQKVIEGEQGGISQAVNWQGGGGFRFMRLGEPMFEADGSIHPAVRFATLAGFVWMQETGLPLGNSSFRRRPEPSRTKIPHSGQDVVPLRGAGELLDSGLRRNDAKGNTPLLGVHEGRAIYLLFNGILGDKRPQSGNVLTQEVLAAIHRICPHEGEKLIYGEACRLGEKRLAAEGITFKHIPYDVKAR